MKKNIFVSAIVAIVLFIGCSPEGSVRSVDYQTFAEEIAVDDIVLVDVRTPEEYAAGHIPGAINIDSSAENFEEQISRIFDASEWIIDGNYNRTIEMRLQQCDTVFLFDLPTDVCIQGARDRLGERRYDLPWIDKELSESFLRSIEEFPEKSLPKIYELLEKYREDKQIIVFRSREDADDYLAKIT